MIINTKYLVFIINDIDDLKMNKQKYHTQVGLFFDGLIKCFTRKSMYRFLTLPNQKNNSLFWALTTKSLQSNF